MITYQSTRGEEKSYTFSEALLQGIAHDGGLLVPQTIPTFSRDDLQQLTNASYQEVAYFVFFRFQTGIPSRVLQAMIHKAYASNFDKKEITPVVALQDKQYLLELMHGPTAAFKDLALQIMPLLFAAAEKKQKPAVHHLILVATSGDTGKAALEGYKDKEGVSLIVFYPEGHVSQLQKLQMQTQTGANVHVVAMQGNFDDCQRSVKEVFTDTVFAKELFAEHNIVLSSANSINWGRLLPQIVYYIFGYLQLVRKKAITLGDPVDVAVPTGNFGNILACFYAKKMGLPIAKLICASNANNVLTEFLQTGVYDISKRSLIQTPSPSMDILVASNIERLLFLLTHDAQQVAAWMHELQTKKKFTVDNQTKRMLQQTFIADWVPNAVCLVQIKRVFDKTGYLMDPHTAIAQKVAETFSSKKPVLICATADFSKFVKDVYRALFGSKNMPQDEFALLAAIQNATNVPLPQSILSLNQKPLRHTKTCGIGKEAVEKHVRAYISSKMSS